ncbi:hypothetical protein STENM223S_11796 [Streptomyces tendae]
MFLLLLSTFVLQPFQIPSGSMERGLRIGDRVLVNKLAYRFDGRPRRGDIVVFDGTGLFGDGDYIERVVGVAGTMSSSRDKEGRVRRIGQSVDESAFLHPGDRPSTVPFDVVVPDGTLFVLGDHRADSSHSRDHPRGSPGCGRRRWTPRSAATGSSGRSDTPPCIDRPTPTRACRTRRPVPPRPAPGTGAACWGRRWVAGASPAAAGSPAENLLPTGSRRTAAPSGGRSRAERRKLQRKVKRRRRRGAVKEIPLLIGVAVLIALVLKTFLVQAFVIPSGSMEQTIRIGYGLGGQAHPLVRLRAGTRGRCLLPRPRRLAAGRADHQEDDPVGVKQVKEGLAFIGLLPSDDEKDLIKRVVGVGGDHVKCCDTQGRVTVNGVPLNEDYLYPGDSPSRTPFDVTVPEGRLWVMGDHRSNSADSRFHQDTDFGTVSEDEVVGRAMVIAWPFGHWATLD